MSIVSPVQAKSSPRPQYLPFPSTYRNRSGPGSSSEERRAYSPPVANINTMTRPQAAYTVPKTNINHRRETTRPISSKPKLSKLSISGPVSPPFYPSVPFNEVSNHETTVSKDITSGGSLKQIGQHMPLNLTWHSTLRFVLRIITIALSAAVAGLLAHTLSVLGNTNTNVSTGQFPSTWPSHTDATATYLLFSIAFVNFLFAVTILICSIKKQFRTSMGARDRFRVGMGAYIVIAWATACTVYKALDADSSTSLGHFACMNVNAIGTGRKQYRTVCREQNVSFYISIVTGVLEILVLASYIVNAYATKSAQLPARDPEKCQSAHVSRR
ncbi:uncharacterized protein BDZ99DRAFT_464301 [Mytilinidion resinicola]|uniref:MARVEL domain-containing protein n=1 Tax=Mytilinidion resinicola TaxID=574789 RepID=A0A6A6YIM9_9PEZI|nr:uncharacterized protein BDZ99DRAFT_464301 [Mytilinidion resinicola]KAF2808419.1 hypothetical protein BDZ99DRAFT_464301 [Mytilinidion resinicola]